MNGSGGKHNAVHVYMYIQAHCDVHVSHAIHPEARNLPRSEVRPQAKYSGALVEIIGGDAVKYCLTHGHAEHLTNPFVVPEGELA
jgi:hypothetical protein